VARLVLLLAVVAALWGGLRLWSFGNAILLALEAEWLAFFAWLGLGLLALL
jgi:hypothetical protein